MAEPIFDDMVLANKGRFKHGFEGKTTLSRPFSLTLDCDDI